MRSDSEFCLPLDKLLLDPDYRFPCLEVYNAFSNSMNLDYRIAFINNQRRLEALCESLGSINTLALDIETINWWNPLAEKVALIQLAYRVNNKILVSIIDALAPLDLTVLRSPLEFDSTMKVIHNACFDAVRLERHFKINAAPVHDTMMAAHRSGEKRYSLKAQVEKHLNLSLNKQAQQSDWSLRPLQPKQLDYAALDAVATLLLYEHQVKRGLKGDYRLRAPSTDKQVSLPMGGSLPGAGSVEKPTLVNQPPQSSEELSDSSLALLGIITELPTRYHPEQLAVSVGLDRVGLAGWIIDRVLGVDADVDESTAKIEIGKLCQRGLIRITRTRRLEASEEGQSTWHKRKPV